MQVKYPPLNLQLSVTPYHPDELSEDNIYRFKIMKDGNLFLYLFNAPVESMRTAEGRSFYRKEAIYKLVDANVHLEDIVELASQLDSRTVGVLAGKNKERE